MLISYQNHLLGVTAEHLQGFFVGWPNPPSPEIHLALLHGSTHQVLAVDDAVTGPPVIGFINAVSDGIMMAFIPLLEVLPPYQGRGIGRELVERLLAQLESFYAIDLMCDPDLIPFYEQFGLQPAGGMIKRNYENQSGNQ